MDVTDGESVKNAATRLKDVVIDVLVNSAGIAGVPRQKTGNVDYESWAQVLNVNTMIVSAPPESNSRRSRFHRPPNRDALSRRPLGRLA